MMQMQLTLENVAANFLQWRKNRKNRAEPIPANLWSQVKMLLPYYKCSMIARRLGISGSQIKKLQATPVRSSESDEALCASHFVTATFPAPQKEAKARGMLALSISGSNNRRMTLTLDSASLQQLLPCLMAQL